jgi:hypothetical protein
VSQNPTVTSVVWIHRPGVQVFVEGPVESLPVDVAVDIANDLSVQT